MLEIAELASVDDLGELRRDYLASLSAPLDGMWEVLATMGRQMEICSAGQRVGYFSLNDEGLVLQFHLARAFESAAIEIFAEVLSCDQVQGAMVSTADSLFMNLCLDAHKKVKVHTYLYQDDDRREAALQGEPQASLDVVEAGELEAIANLHRDSLDRDPGDWLVGYLENLIDRRELYALREAGEILATGEVRVSESQPPFADLGVITVRRHRGRGVASHLLGRLKQLCYDRELVPICSTTKENVAAQRAIVKAGFVSRHRILKVEF